MRDVHRQTFRLYTNLLHSDPNPALPRPTAPATSVLDIPTPVDVPAPAAVQMPPELEMLLQMGYDRAKTLATWHVVQAASPCRAISAKHHMLRTGEMALSRDEILVPSAAQPRRPRLIPDGWLHCFVRALVIPPVCRVFSRHAQTPLIGHIWLPRPGLPLAQSDGLGRPARRSGASASRAARRDAGGAERRDRWCPNPRYRLLES